MSTNNIFLSWVCVHCGRGMLSIHKPKPSNEVRGHTCEYEREREPQSREPFAGWTQEEIDSFIQPQGQLFDEDGEAI